MFDRFSREDRTIMMFAVQEARDLGHPGIGNDHLILGMLCNARSPLFGLLGEQGLTLDTARDAVRAHHEAHPDESSPEDAAESSAQSRYEEDREALRSIGIDLDRVREAVASTFGDDVAEGWGDRPRGRRRGPGGPDDCGERGRGPRGRHGHGRGHDHGHGRGEGRGRGGPRGERRGRGPWGPDDREFAGRGPWEGGSEGAAGEGGPWEGGRGRRGPRGRGRARMDQSTRAALHHAMGVAQSRGDSRLRPEHVLLGILEVGDPASRAVIDAVTDVDTLRAAVAATLPDPATI